MYMLPTLHEAENRRNHARRKYNMFSRGKQQTCTKCYEIVIVASYSSVYIGTLSDNVGSTEPGLRVVQDITHHLVEEPRICLLTSHLQFSWCRLT